MYKRILAVIKITIVFLILGTVVLFGYLPHENIDAQSTNQITENGDSADDEEIIAQLREDHYERVAENDHLILYMNLKSLSLRIQNKATGYKWNSAPVEPDETMNRRWQEFSRSALTIEYMEGGTRRGQISSVAEGTFVEIDMIDSGFIADVRFEEPGITLSLHVRLEDDTLSVKIPNDSIREEKAEFSLQAVYLYPFLGATKDAPGYLFIPDGSGAIIRTDRKTIATLPFSGRVFGADVGITDVRIERELPMPENITIPTFGIVRERDESAFVAIIEGGSYYSEIIAYPRGVTTQFFWATSRFIYREMFRKLLDGRGTTINVNQEVRNNFDASIRYAFLSGDDADYVGMALRYRQVLLNQGILREANVGENEDIPIRIEFLTAENKQGLLGDYIIPMTTVDEMRSILNDLWNNNLRQKVVVVRGWPEGGATGSSPAHFPFERITGTKSHWIDFLSDFEEKGIPIYLFTDYMAANKRGTGFRRDDIAQAISGRLISFPFYYILNPFATDRIFRGQMERFKEYGISGIAVSSIGERLISSHDEGVGSSRANTADIYANMFSDLSGKMRFALYNPNVYLWNVVSQNLDVPMDSSGFLIESDSVPFLQIVLRGSINYFGSFINFEGNRTREILRHIDYGSYPSFILTHKDPVKLIDTGSNWIFTSQYEVLKEEVLSAYAKINSALKYVRGKSFISRETIAEGVVKNTFSNGVSIFINYTDKEFKYMDILIPAQDFAVMGGYKN